MSIDTHGPSVAGKRAKRDGTLLLMVLLAVLIFMQAITLCLIVASEWRAQELSVELGEVHDLLDAGTTSLAEFYTGFNAAVAEARAHRKALDNHYDATLARLRADYGGYDDELSKLRTELKRNQAADDAFAVEIQTALKQLNSTWNQFTAEVNRALDILKEAG